MISKKKTLSTIFKILFYYIFFKSIIFESHYQILLESSVFCDTSLPSIDENLNPNKFNEISECDSNQNIKEITDANIFFSKDKINDLVIVFFALVLLGLEIYSFDDE